MVWCFFLLGWFGLVLDLGLAYRRRAYYITTTPNLIFLISLSVLGDMGLSFVYKSETGHIMGAVSLISDCGPFSYSLSCNSTCPPRGKWRGMDTSFVYNW